jgi:hypothetical protein
MNTSKAIFPMFPCLDANIDKAAPTKGKTGQLPWKQCVNEEYLGDCWFLTFPDAGTRFSILIPGNVPDEAFPTLLDQVMVGMT